MKKLFQLLMLITLAASCSDEPPAPKVYKCKQAKVDGQWMVANCNHRDVVALPCYNGQPCPWETPAYIKDKASEYRTEWMESCDECYEWK